MAVPETDPSGGDGAGTEGPELAVLRRRVFAAVKRRCPPDLAQQAEDIVQVVMMRLVGYLEKGEANRTFSSIYLEKAASGVMIDEIRRRSRSNEVADEGEWMERVESHSASPERQAASTEIARGIQDCLKRLIRPRRLAATLFVYGCSVPETAKRLGWSFKRADNLVWRGLADLRKCLQEKGLEP